MKYFKRANIYKNSTGNNILEVDTMKAFSYNWWCYLMPTGTGKYIFNNYRYSPTTGKHQFDMRSLLRKEFGICSENIVFVDFRESLSNMTTKEALTKQCEVLRDEVNELERLIAKKGTKRKKNAERAERINELSAKIVNLNEEFDLEYNTEGLFFTELDNLLKTY